jgi:TPR repeat protein
MGLSANNGRLGLFVVFLLAYGASYAPAQQNEADRKLLDNIRTRSERGEAEAEFELGTVYEFGKLGVIRDLVKAVNWYRKAASQNNSEAQCYLGVCYRNGAGVAKDYAEAVNWFRKAAEQDNAPAQNNLGVSYRNGEGVATDCVEAVKWFRKGADQRNANAEFNLGACFETGQGVNRSNEEAVKWYRKAAEQNFASAQYNLAYCYYMGFGIARDYMEAVRWYRKAADQNDVSAQYNLGFCYYRGHGVVKDYVESYKWGLLSAAQDDAQSRKLVTVLERLMTPDQIAEGQKLARDFKPRGMGTSDVGNSAADISQTRPEGSGTGFFISEDGYLITNEHVVRDGVQVRLVTTAGLIPAKVVKVDGANDLALLKADGYFATLPVASSRAAKMGTMVATIGFPNIGLQGFSPKLAKGEIASVSGAQDDPRYFQISVPVQPGNSGGPLVDEHANVVGVVSAKLSAAAALATSGSLPENVNYAVKSSFLLGFLESVPEVSAKLKEPNTKDCKFEDVVKSAEEASVLVLVY